MTVEHIYLGGHAAVKITQPGLQPAVFVRYGWLPFGQQRPDVRLVQGVAFKGYWEAARAALSNA